MKYKTVRTLALSVVASLAFCLGVTYAQSIVHPGDTVDMPPAKRAKYARIAGIRAFDLYTNGLISEESGDYYHAARSYKAALGFFPESTEIRFALANAYINLREVELALQVANKVERVNLDILGVMARAYRLLNDDGAYRATYVRMTELDPDSYHAFDILSKIYLRKRSLDSAAWALENLSRIKPANPKTWNRLGRVRLSLSEHEEALEAFDRSLELDHSLENLNGLLGRADVLEGMNQPDSATRALKVALDLTGPNPMLLSRIATTLTSQDRFAEATGYIRQLVEQVPEDMEQQRRLGMIYYYADSLKQAELIFDTLILQNDINDLNHYFLGLVYTDQNKATQAKDQFTIVTDLAGSNADAWINLGLAYRFLEQTDSALATYQRGLPRVSTADDSLRLIYTTGATQEELNLVDDAISSFEWVLAINPEYHPAMNYLGYLMADRNMRLEYALELLTKAIEFQPDNSAYLDSYGWVCYRLGDFDKALEYLKRAVELDSDPVMFDHLGDVFSATGDGDEARSWWQKALDLDPDNNAIKEKLND